jgi:hypothetical protein
MRGPEVLAAPPIPLGYESRDKYKGPLGYWQHRQYLLGMKVEISMRGLRGIGGTANTFGYEISVTYEGPPGYWRQRIRGNMGSPNGPVRQPEVDHLPAQTPWRC